MWTKEQIHELVLNQQKYFRTNETLDLDWRIYQLKRLRTAIRLYEDELKAALVGDLGRSETEAYLADIGAVIMEINETIAGLKRWAKPELHLSGPACFPSIFTRVYKMPYGTTLIISPFNFPVMLSIGPLAAALAGGNTAVIKASSKSPATTRVLSKMISETFPEKYISVVDGGHDVADMLLEERFDKIFYTGSPRVGSHVMELASHNLTPVALELGGETGNWAIVRSDADIWDAARKIAFFKIMNSGQICININQVAVEESVYDLFIECLKDEIIRQIGEEPIKNPEYPHLINRGAYSKCAALAEEYSDRILHGGNGNPETLHFEPTVIGPVKIDEEIVMHELFCPLLPIVPYKESEEDALLDTIAEREHGLALYVFTKDKKRARQIMTTQQYGGGCINEVCVHMMVKGVPFNGTGHSGIGAYHGEWGFKEFTHPQTVLEGSTRFNLPLREHPYTGPQGDWKLKVLKVFQR
ncbi:MAG: aldehyde dehydrogenase family protein [Firmicutes bacterium]|nr:aldehyde dehydrogenase family protein [Bacillota bacterium]